MFDLRKARERAHLLEGLIIAQDNIDEVIRIIRESYDDAKERLMERFSLDDVQAQAILEMRLRQLQKLDREKLLSEYQEIEKKIAWYEEVLADPEKIKQILKEELTELEKKYGDARKTEIQEIEDEIDFEDLIDEEQCVYTLSHNGYIKRTPAAEYRQQSRGGKGVRGMTTREEDSVETLFTASTHDNILFFTSFGRCYDRKGYRIPEAGRTARGTSIVNILPLMPGERVTAMLHVREFTDDVFLFFITKGGTVKRLMTSELKNARRTGIRALNLVDDDELISVRLTSGHDNILISTHDGMTILFNETDIRPMGRTAAGVRGIKLRDGDYCVSGCLARQDGTLFIVTEKGYGKRVLLDDFLRGGSDESLAGTPMRRGGMGVKGLAVSERTGAVAAAKVVSEDDDVLMIASDGSIIRIPASDVSIYGRAAGGMRVMRLEEGEKVISLARMAPENDEGDGDTE